MKVINFFGGPSVGKSTQAAFLFWEMKKRGFKVELVSEYAKQLTWEDRSNALSDQIYVFAKQQRAIDRLKGKVDYIITDGPLMHSLVYAPPELGETFHNLVLEVIERHENINIYLHRDVPYKEDGRSQSLSEAKAIDSKVRNALHAARYGHIILTPKELEERVSSVIAIIEDENHTGNLHR